MEGNAGGGGDYGGWISDGDGEGGSVEGDADVWIEFDGSIVEDLVGVGDSIVDEEAYLQQSAEDEIDVEDFFEGTVESDILVELHGEDGFEVLNGVGGLEAERTVAGVAGGGVAGQALKERGVSVVASWALGEAVVVHEVGS